MLADLRSGDYIDEVLDEQLGQWLYDATQEYVAERQSKVFEEVSDVVRKEPKLVESEIHRGVLENVLQYIGVPNEDGVATKAAETAVRMGDEIVSTEKQNAFRESFALMQLGVDSDGEDIHGKPVHIPKPHTPTSRRLHGQSSR